MKTKLQQYLKDHHFSIQSPFWGELKLEKAQLGEGGNGIVYKTALGKGIEVAVKFLVAQENNFKEKFNRFRDEYTNVILAELKYGVKYYHADFLKIENDLEIPYITMKCYKGNLKELRNQQDSSENRIAENLLKFLLNSVEEIHKNGIIHRDIKPENILVSDTGEFVLSDFGIAHFDSETYENNHKTRKGERLGNRLYSAPEQNDPNVSPTPAMDIYAIAQVLYFWDKGAPHLSSDPIILDTLPNYYNEILEKCLLQDPLKRYQSIKDIRDSIQSHNESYKDQIESNKAMSAILALDEIFRSNFPKHWRITKEIRQDRIKRLLESFDKHPKYKEDLRYFRDNDSWYDVSPSEVEHVKENLWRFGHNQLAIDSIWVISDDTCFQKDNHCILIHHVPYEKKNDSQECFYDGNLISPEENENGYVEHEDGIISKIDDSKRDFVDHISQEGYLLMGTWWSCFQLQKNDESRASFLQELTSGELEPTEDNIFKGVHQFRVHHDSNVMRNA